MPLKCSTLEAFDTNGNGVWLSPAAAAINDTRTSSPGAFLSALLCLGGAWRHTCGQSFYVTAVALAYGAAAGNRCACSAARVRVTDNHIALVLEAQRERHARLLWWTQQRCSCFRTLLRMLWQEHVSVRG